MMLDFLNIFATRFCLMSFSKFINMKILHVLPKSQDVEKKVPVS